MDIDEAKHRLAENPPQGDPTEIPFGETLAELTARFEGIKRAMAAPSLSPEEIALGKAEDRAMADRIHRALPGIPLHHAFAVLETLRIIRRTEAAVDGELLGGGE